MAVELLAVVPLTAGLVGADGEPPGALGLEPLALEPLVLEPLGADPFEPEPFGLEPVGPAPLVEAPVLPAVGGGADDIGADGDDPGVVGVDKGSTGTVSAAAGVAGCEPVTGWAVAELDAVGAVVAEPVVGAATTLGA